MAPAQVAIAWTRSKSAVVLPVIGVSSVAQLTENLGAVDLVLPDDAVRQLEAAVPFWLGFPSDFLADCEADPFVFGDSAARLDVRR